MHEEIILLFIVKDYSLALIKEILFTESKEKKVVAFADAKSFSPRRHGRQEDARRCKGLNFKVYKPIV